MDRPLWLRLPAPLKTLPPGSRASADEGQADSLSERIHVKRHPAPNHLKNLQAKECQGADRAEKQVQLDTVIVRTEQPRQESAHLTAPDTRSCWRRGSSVAPQFNSDGLCQRDSTASDEIDVYARGAKWCGDCGHLHRAIG